MKKVHLAIALFLLVQSISAQNYNQEVDLGIRAGYTGTTYSEFKRSDLPEGYDLRNYGWGLGAFLQLRVNHIYFQPELLYAHASTVIASPLPNDPIDIEIDMDFHSVQLPLILGYRTSFGENAFRFGGGAFVNFLLGTGGELILDPGGSADLPSDFFEDFNTITVGARVNLGFDWGPMAFDAFYQTGFSRLAEELALLGNDFNELGKERTWGLSIGYKIIRNKLDPY